MNPVWAAVERRFAERLMAARIGRSWTTAQLAQVSGMNARDLDRIEDGRRGIGLGEAVILADVLGIALPSWERA